MILGDRSEAQGAAPTVGLLDRAAYAAGSFGTGVFSTVPAILLLYFCTEILRMPAAWASLIVFVPKIWAIVWDPLVGAWSDRANTSWGRRRPFMLAGAWGMALMFIALFSPPALGPGTTIGWMMLAYFLLATVYSLFAVPYIAIPSESTISEETRGRLVAWRMLVAMIGVLAGAGLVPQIVELSGGARLGYHRMSLLMATACLLAMLMPIWMLRGRDVCESRLRARTTVWRQLGSVARHRSFVRLVCAYVLQLTAVGVISASAPYLVTGALHRSEGEIGTAMIGMLGVTTLSIPLWAWAARRYGATRALISAVLVFGFGALAIGALALAHPTWPATRIAFAFAGLGFAGMQVLPYTLVATLIHSAAADATAGESSFAGMWTAAEKVGLALGPAMTGLVLTAWPGQKISAISLLTVIAPITLGLLSLPLLIAATRARSV